MEGSLGSSVRVQRTQALGSEAQIDPRTKIKYLRPAVQLPSPRGEALKINRLTHSRPGYDDIAEFLRGKRK